MTTKKNTINLNKNLYKGLYLIRSAENTIIARDPENEMKTPMHMSLGQEAIAVGVCHALGKRGQILCSYRSHAVYLANTGETDKFFGELYGKTTGMAKGRAGSMHLSSPETGFLGASAVVASTLPVAVGAAFANKIQGNEKITVVFFGDGAIDEGNFWESLNMACLMRLPVLFVCEDNGFAVHSPTSQRHGYKSLPQIVRQYECTVFEKSTTDVEIIFNLAQTAISRIEDTGKPSLLYLKYYRYLRHVGTTEDFGAGYRPRDEYEKWRKVDPIDFQRKKLLRLGIGMKEIKLMERKINNQIEKSVRSARKAPFPDLKDLYERNNLKKIP